MVGSTIQTVNSPIYDTYMSTPGNTAKLGATHSNIQTAQRCPSWLGANLQYISQYTTESALNPLCQLGITLSRQRAVKEGGAALLQARMADFHRKDTLQPKLGSKYFFGI